jgi:hypothetical protein
MEVGITTEPRGSIAKTNEVRGFSLEIRGQKPETRKKQKPQRHKGHKRTLS